MYLLIKDHVDLLNHLTAEEATLRERIDALEGVLINLKAGYNPNYQDMAVLEAVRGWDGLNPAEEPSSGSTPDVSQSTEIENPTAAAEEVFWTKDRISELKATNPLSVLLEHEQHISGGGSDDIRNTRK